MLIYLLTNMLSEGIHVAIIFIRPPGSAHIKRNYIKKSFYKPKEAKRPYA